MASSEAVSAPFVEDVTSKETEVSPTVEEALSPTEQIYNEPGKTISSDEEIEKDFEDEDEQTEALSPINKEPEPDVSFEGSGFTEFNEEGEDKEDEADEEEEDD